MTLVVTFAECSEENNEVFNSLIKHSRIKNMHDFEQLVATIGMKASNHAYIFVQFEMYAEKGIATLYDRIREREVTISVLYYRISFATQDDVKSANESGYAVRIKAFVFEQ